MSVPPPSSLFPGSRRAPLSRSRVTPAPNVKAALRCRAQSPNTAQLFYRLVAKRCAAQIFASSHWVQGAPLPPTAQVILPSPLPLPLHRFAPRLSLFQDRNALDAAFLTEPGRNPGWSSV